MLARRTDAVHQNIRARIRSGAARLQCKGGAAPGQTLLGLTGPTFSISDYSAGISWRQPRLVAAPAEGVAVVAAAAPGAQSGVPAAAEAVAAPAGAAAVAQALLSAAADAAAVVAAAAKRGVWAQRVRPAEAVLEALPRVSAVAVVGALPFGCAQVPARHVLFQGPEPNRRILAQQQRLPSPPETSGSSSPICQG